MSYVGMNRHKDILLLSPESLPLAPHCTPQIIFCASLSPPTISIIYFMPLLVTITLGINLTCKFRVAWINGKKCLGNWSARLYNVCWKILHRSQLMKTGSSIHKCEIHCLWYIIILIGKWALYIHVQEGKRRDSFPKMVSIFFWIRISKSRRLTYSVCALFLTTHSILQFISKLPL